MSSALELSQELVEWSDRVKPDSKVLQFARALDVASTFDSAALNPSVMEIMKNILAADDEDAIFAAANAGTTSGKDFGNIPFLLKSDEFQYKKSRTAYIETNGFPFYALMRITNLETGESQVLNCGGFTFMTTLWQLDTNGIIKKYDREGGIPLVFELKPATVGAVVIPKRYRLPKSLKNHATAKTSDTQNSD